MTRENKEELKSHNSSYFDGYVNAYYKSQDEYKYKLREKVYDFLNSIQLEKYVETFDGGQLDFTDEFYNELGKAMEE